MFKKLKNSSRVNESVAQSYHSKNTFSSFLLLFLRIAYVQAQIVYEPLYEDVYNFLRRVSQKGIIEFDDLIRPLPKMYIAEKLLETDSLSSKLTSLEKEELKFFLENYYFEEWFIEGNNKKTEYMDWFNEDPADRWRVFSYGGDGFKINVRPYSWCGNWFC